MKVFLAVIFVVVAGYFIYVGMGANISGVVIDCTTNQPVSRVVITASQSGWSLTPYPTWNKEYEEKTLSGNNGAFSMHVALRDPMKLSTMKSGYIQAIEPRYSDSGQTIKILPASVGISSQSSGTILYTQDCIMQ